MPLLRPLDPSFPIQRQLAVDAAPVVLVNVFLLDEADEPTFLKAWRDDAEFMKRQPGFISTQLHRAIGDNPTYLNTAVWESTAAFRAAFAHPEFVAKLSAYPPRPSRPAPLPEGRDPGRLRRVAEERASARSSANSLRNDCTTNCISLPAVKVRENWLDDPERYRAMGLEFPKGRGGGSSPSPRLRGEGRGEGRRRLLAGLGISVTRPFFTNDRPLMGKYACVTVFPTVFPYSHRIPGDGARIPEGGRGGSSPSPRLRGEGRGEGRRRLLRPGLAQPSSGRCAATFSPRTGRRESALTGPARPGS
jgi:heme-degrading monooxygenase HmoA